MRCFDAVWRISLKRTSPAEQELDRGSLRNLASVSAVKYAHLVLRILVYLRYGSVGGSGNQSTNVMITFRWLEQREMSGCQVAPTDWCGETIVRSGDELGPVFETLVGESSLIRASWLVLRRSTMELPHEFPWSSPVRENQALLWAMKSPLMMV